jgi:dihydrofolate reductase
MREMILAIDRSNAIGYHDGRLAWRIKADMQHFKQNTMGKTVVMGHKTFVSLCNKTGLPGRTNVVLSSRNREELQLDQAVELIHSIRDIPENCVIIGGASLYDQVLDAKIIDVINVTLIGESSNADVKLTHQLGTLDVFLKSQAESGVQWQVTNSESVKMTDSHPSFKFVNLRRI